MDGLPSLLRYPVFSTSSRFHRLYNPINPALLSSSHVRSECHDDSQLARTAIALNGIEARSTRIKSMEDLDAKKTTHWMDFVMTALDYWTEVLRCPVCASTGIARLSQKIRRDGGRDPT